MSGWCCFFMLMMGLVGGCENMFKLPRMPEIVEPIRSGVRDVRVVELTEHGTSVAVELWLENPNDFELPLTRAIYTIKVGEGEYRGNYEPLATLPAKGRLTISVPGAVSVSAQVGMNYAVEGKIRFRAPGEIQKLLNDMGAPFPEAKFELKDKMRKLPEKKVEAVGGEGDAKPEDVEEEGAGGS